MFSVKSHPNILCFTFDSNFCILTVEKQEKFTVKFSFTNMKDSDSLNPNPPCWFMAEKRQKLHEITKLPNFLH